MTAALVPSFLRLLATHRAIPAPTLADLVLLEIGEKESIRFAVPADVRAALDTWAESGGLYRACVGARLRPAGEWNLIEPLEGGASGGSSDVDVVVYARSASLADELCQCEVRGRADRAGELLGYPPCCVAAYAHYASAPSGWLPLAVRQTGAGPWWCWCNRLPLGWGAPTFVGEIYPCSFRCEALAERGERVYRAMRRLGLERLARVTLEQSLRPVAFRSSPDVPDDAVQLALDVGALGDVAALPAWIRWTR